MGSRNKKWELPVSEKLSLLVKAIREPAEVQREVIRDSTLVMDSLFLSPQDSHFEIQSFGVMMIIGNGHLKGN